MRLKSKWLSFFPIKENLVQTVCFPVQRRAINALFCAFIAELDSAIELQQAAVLSAVLLSRSPRKDKGVTNKGLTLGGLKDIAHGMIEPLLRNV